VHFKPQGVAMRDLQVVELSLEEIEAFRLRHAEGLEQQDAAIRMKTSTSSYQRLLRSSSAKIADALTEGKAMTIFKHRIAG
jgi:uncharacterized protein